jgi:hypothetical protein
MTAIALALALSLGSVASDAPVPDVTQEAPPLAAASSVGTSHTRWGLMLDGGLPDLVGASVLYRPLPWLRVNGGLATNTAGVAVRAGVGVAFYFPITPSLNLDVGHYFPADYRPLAQRLGMSTPDETVALALQDIGYDFASATVGLELGSPRHFSFFVRAGISYWSFNVGQSEAILRAALQDEGLTADPIQLRFTSPSAKVGFLIYFK